MLNSLKSLIQAILKEMRIGLVPDHHNKVSIIIKLVVSFFLWKVLPSICKKNATSVKHNKGKHNKIRYACSSGVFMIKKTNWPGTQLVRASSDTPRLQVQSPVMAHARNR